MSQGSRDEVVRYAERCSAICRYPIIVQQTLTRLIFFLGSAATEWANAPSRQIRGLGTTDLTYSSCRWKKV
jgi:hypothetical protein